jgi:hypothetical protein
VKFALVHVAHRLLAEHVEQNGIVHCTQVPVELTVRLLAQLEQKLLALHSVHWATLQLAQAWPLLIGFPDVQVVHVLLAVQRVQLLMLQRKHTPPEAV